MVEQCFRKAKVVGSTPTLGSIENIIVLVINPNKMANPELSREQGPVIRLTENREAIEKKLDEYKSRYDTSKAPEQQYDTIYKIAVAQKLVDEGQVDTYALSNELAAKFGPLDIRLFNTACAVMADYIQTGGQNNRGGTGLPEGKIESPDTDEDDQSPAHFS